MRGDGDHPESRRGGGEERETGELWRGGRDAGAGTIGGAHGEGGVDVRDVVSRARRAAHRAIAQGGTVDRTGEGTARGFGATERRGVAGGVSAAEGARARSSRRDRRGGRAITRASAKVGREK